jgi:hypothetical protein
MSKFARGWSSSFVVVLFGGISLLAASGPARAGQGAANPAGISGIVTDNTGAVLPG